MELRQKAVSGVKWTSSSTIIVSIIDFFRLSILARLLGPDNFGLVCMVMVVIGFSQAFIDMGISNAIIQKQNNDHDKLSSLYWLNIFGGIVVFFLVIAASPFIVAFYNEPALKDLIPWAAFSFLIIPIGQQFQILLQKELKFKVLAKVEIASTAIGAIVAITSAFMGEGAFAIIWGTIAGSIIRSVMLVIGCQSEWRPSLHFRFSDLKEYINFGLYQMGERSVNYFSAYIDYLFIGHYLGKVPLGAYTLANQLVVMPLLRINPILTRVAFPVFSKRHTDNAMLRYGYLEMLKLIAYVTFPILVGFAATSKVFVPLFFGTKTGWDISITLIPILAILGIFKTLGNPSGSILLAKGRADIGFKWNLSIAIVNTFVFWYAAQKGLLFLSWTWVVLGALYFVAGWFILFRIVGLQFGEYLSVIFRPLMISIVMGVGVYGIYLFIRNSSAIKLFSLSILFVSGISIYLILILLFERAYFKNLYNLILKRK